MPRAFQKKVRCTDIDNIRSSVVLLSSHAFLCCKNSHTVLTDTESPYMVLLTSPSTVVRSLRQTLHLKDNKRPVWYSSLIPWTRTWRWIWRRGRWGAIPRMDPRSGVGSTRARPSLRWPRLPEKYLHHGIDLFLRENRRHNRRAADADTGGGFPARSYTPTW